MARLLHNLLLLTVRLTLKIKVLGYWSLIYGYCALCTAVALLKLWWSILIRPSTTFQWAIRETPPACLNDTSLGTHCYVRIKVRCALHHESIWRRSVCMGNTDWILRAKCRLCCQICSVVLEANANDQQRRALVWNEIVRYLLTNSLFNMLPTCVFFVIQPRVVWYLMLKHAPVVLKTAPCAIGLRYRLALLINNDNWTASSRQVFQMRCDLNFHIQEVQRCEKEKSSFPKFYET